MYSNIFLYVAVQKRKTYKRFGCSILVIKKIFLRSMIMLYMYVCMYVYCIRETRDKFYRK